VTRTRIITGPGETLIAQLTLTALHDSPVDWTSIQMSVMPAAPSNVANGAGFGEAPNSNAPGRY